MQREARSLNPEANTMSTITDEKFTLALQRAEKIGERHGKNGAEWVAQDTWGGRVSSARGKEAARAFLRGYEYGDPEILDSYASPNLSGEYADGYTPDELLRDCFESRQDIADLEPEEADEICRAYEIASDETFWNTLSASALGALED
jgi:hypothetical protein